LQALLNKNSVRTLEELTKALNIGKSIVFDHLFAIHEKKGKWILHNLIQNR